MLIAFGDGTLGGAGYFVILEKAGPNPSASRI
jgi:hypothetical protein